MSVKSVSIGEIHVPGSGTLQNARTFLLTAPASSAGTPALLFGIFAADAPRKVVEKLCDRVAEEARPAFFSEGDEAGFEKALTNINRVIVGFLYDHGLSMHGIRLRGALGGLSDGQLFVASRGNLKGLLLVPQCGALVPYTLFEEAAARENDPKFFSSLQAGRLPPGSRLLATTGELFQALDEAFVRDVFVRSDADGAVRALKNALRASRLPVAALTLTVPGPELADAPQARRAAAGGREQGAADVAPPQRRAPKIPPPAPTDFGELAARGLRAAVEFGVRGLLALLRLLGRALLAAGRLPFAAARALAALCRAESRAKLIADCRAAPDRCLAAGIGRLNAIPAASRIHLYLLLACAAVFLHGILFSFRHQLAVNEAKAYEAKLAEFHGLQADFEASLIYDEDRRSRDLLARMRAILDALPAETKAQRRAKDDAAASLEKAAAALRRLVLPASVTAVADLTGRTGFEDGIIARFGGKLYVFSRTSPAVLAVAAGDVLEKKLDGAASGAAAVAAARTGFLIVGADGKVRYWNPAGTETHEYPGVLLDPPSPVLFYEGRLYYATTEGFIVRRQVAASTLGAPAQALQSPIAPAPMGLAADGALYLLTGDGTVRKFMKGAEDGAFAPPAMDPPLSAASLWTAVGSDRLAFIASGGDRIVLLDKATGRLLAQLSSPELAGLVSMTVADDGRSAAVLAGGKVLDVTLEPAAK